MDKNLRILEFDKIIDKLKDLALTEGAKERFGELKPYLSEQELMSALRDTAEARELLDTAGTPPIPGMEKIGDMVREAEAGVMLSAEQLESVGSFLGSVKRLKGFLKSGAGQGIGLAYGYEALEDLEEIREEIMRMIRGGRIDDYATDQLKNIRRSIGVQNDKLQGKAEGLLKSNKAFLSDNFIVSRSGHICLPVKKEYKFKISGSVIDKSSTGATLFIEPTALSKLSDEINLLKIEEDNEERKILYTLSVMIADHASALQGNIERIITLDFIFAKGKLSCEWKGIAPVMNTERRIVLKKARHPMLEEAVCIPLDFTVGEEGCRGVIITGPNTGGKTVAIKTVGLISLMAQCGLHVPCQEAEICMNSQYLCDIGDGQNITENLSTFSAHISNILEILRKVSGEGLVILDELGSGTDPAEGMGIAVAILEELDKSGCLFIATTHYPEVKVYAEKKQGILNARMAFDKETLKPLYRLEIGKAGESCALYIAGRLGMPVDMIACAGRQAYGQDYDWKDVTAAGNEIVKEYVPGIIKKKSFKVATPESKRAEQFNRGDCVMVSPQQKLGIVVKKADNRGDILIQLKKEKILVNHKRLKLHVAAEEMYPEDYDFTIIFDSVENRKARRQMEKGHGGTVTVS